MDLYQQFLANLKFVGHHADELAAAEAAGNVAALTALALLDTFNAQLKHRQPTQAEIEAFNWAVLLYQHPELPYTLDRRQS